MGIEFGKIGLQVALPGGSARKVIGGEHVMLDFAKNDLDLIEPTGVLGEPVEADLKSQLQRREPCAQLLGAGVGPLSRIK